MRQLRYLLRNNEDKWPEEYSTLEGENYRYHPRDLISEGYYNENVMTSFDGMEGARFVSNRLHLIDTVVTKNPYPNIQADKVEGIQHEKHNATHSATSCIFALFTSRSIHEVAIANYSGSLKSMKPR